MKIEKGNKVYVANIPYVLNECIHSAKVTDSYGESSRDVMVFLLDHEINIPYPKGYCFNTRKQAINAIIDALTSMRDGENE